MLCEVTLTEQFIKTAKRKFGNRFTYEHTDYKHSAKPIAVTCPIEGHGLFYPTPANFIRGHTCPKCAGNRKLTTEEFIAAALKRHGLTYDYSRVTYVSTHVPVEIGCKIHGYFKQMPSNHLRSSGCRACANQRNAKKLSGAGRFIARALKIHGGKNYDYAEVVYVNQSTPVKISCPKHGVWESMPLNHLRGAGCFRCGIDATAKSNFDGKAGFTQKALQVHGDTYDYSETVYVDSSTECRIRCKKHGLFEQRPYSHLSGFGCPACGATLAGLQHRLTQGEFERRIKALNPDYAFNDAVYAGTKAKVTLFCPKHGEFKKAPDHLFRGRGCPICNANSSKGESEVADWMRSLGVEIEQRNRKLIAPQELDIVIPSRQLAVEYNGVYWHSAPIAARGDKAVRNYHAEKTAATTKAGYRLLTVWETDWKDRPETVKHWLWHQLGLQPKLAGARECACERVPEKEARLFYDRYHLQGACVSGKHFGLRHGGQLVALMTFTHSASDRKSKTVAGGYWLTRFALAGHVPGAASRLFAAAVAGLVAQQVTTYSDSTYAHGGVYARLGFQKTADIKPDYRVYHPFYGIQHKSFWQRRNIPDRLAELNVDIVFDPATDPRTEFGMEELLGCRHVWDAGKTRWEWQAAVNG